MNDAMKKILTFSVLAGLMLCGCQKEELKIEETPEQKTFTAEIENNSDGVATKTSLDDQGNVLWSSEDKVSIFAGTTANAEYQVAEAGKTSATLNPVSGSESGTGTEISGNVAYYPYSSTLTISADGTTISGITLPATQKYAQASFASGAFPMAAVTASADETQLKFKNILGGLKLQLTGTAKVRSISVSGNNNEILCGSANVTVSSSADPEITLSDQTATIVTLDCGTEGVQLNETTATPFIIALPPVEMTTGFTVTITDTDGKDMEITTTNSKSIQRSKLLKMKSKEYKADNPFTITSVGETSVAIVKHGDPTDISLEYRINGGKWAEYSVTKTGTAIPLSDGYKLQFRAGKSGNAAFATGQNSYHCVSVSGTGKIEASGEIMSLLNRYLAVSAVPKYGFCRLFYECSALTIAPDLPATSIGAFCYREMFRGCTSLASAPALPSTSLYVSYSNNAEGCYYGMFYGCTGLTTAPALPATTLASTCYFQMFSGCTSLTKAPDLPAKSLARNSYYEMFKGCSRLNYIKALFTSKVAVADTQDWVSGVASEGTFVKTKGASIATGTSGIPEGWTTSEQ